MPVSYIFVLSRSDDESTSSSILCIILTDSEAGDAIFPAAPASLSPDYVPTSPDYTSDTNSDSKTFEEDHKEANPKESFKEEPSEDDSSDGDVIETDEPLQDQTALTPFIQPPPTRLLLMCFKSFKFIRMKLPDIK
ncbi:hypothetical protein Tco_0882148 [Tanacetum coccineum]